MQVEALCIFVQRELLQLGAVRQFMNSNMLHESTEAAANSPQLEDLLSPCAEQPWASDGQAVSAAQQVVKALAVV